MIDIFGIDVFHRNRRTILRLKRSAAAIYRLANIVGLPHCRLLLLCLYLIQSIVFSVPLQDLKLLDRILCHILGSPKNRRIRLLVVVLHHLLSHISPFCAPCFPHFGSQVSLNSLNCSVHNC